jgi:hypothetical protein
MSNSSSPRGQRKSGLAVRGQVISPQLALLEATIEHGRRAFFEMGNALAAIREGRLYRPDYRSFDAYCRERWGLSKVHASRLVVAAQRIRQLGEVVPMGTCLELVTNERQARAIGARVPFIKDRIANGQAPGEAIRAELEQRQQDRRGGRGHLTGRQSVWQHQQQRHQQRRELTLTAWKQRLSDLLLDLEELGEEDREAAISELREEVAGLD